MARTKAQRKPLKNDGKHGIARLGDLSNAIKAVGKSRRGENPSSLSGFAKVCDDLFERKRVEDLQIAKQAKRDLPSWIDKIKRLSNDELFHEYDTALNGTASNINLRRVMAFYRGKVKAEMIRRMEG